MAYDYSKFNHSNPFELKLTGSELESLLKLLDEEWIKKQSLNSELQTVRSDLHTFLSSFYLANSQPLMFSEAA